jgi:SNF2 family DNA or RNA helicase
VDSLIELWAHQKEALSRSQSLDDFGLFFEMGTGKTATTINCYRAKCIKHDRVLRALIFCPPIVIENWRREFGMHSHMQDDVVCLVGTGKQREETFIKHSRKPTIFVTNYESLLMPQLLQMFINYAPEVLIVDESHKCKDLKAKRTKAMIRLADQARYRFILSGTPILNSPMDIFAQFRILDGGATFGKNFFAFRAKYFVDKNAHMPRDRYFPNWAIRPGGEAEIGAAIAAKSMRVTKADALDLPPLLRTQVYVGMSPEQDRLYQQMRQDFITYINDKACVAQLAITKALRLMQIVSGFVVVEGENERQTITIKDNPRATALKELLAEICQHSKCITWLVFSQDYIVARKICEDLAINYVEITGEVSAKDKMAAVDRFHNDPDCKVLIGHPGSGGIGINLCAAGYAIFYSRNFSLEQDLQAEARNHRGGSGLLHTKITRIDLVTKGTIDELVLNRLANKVEISEKVLRDLANEI